MHTNKCFRSEGEMVCARGCTDRNDKIVALAKAYVELNIDSARNPCDGPLHNSACMAFDELREALGIPDPDEEDADAEDDGE